MKINQKENKTKKEDKKKQSSLSAILTIGVSLPWKTEYPNGCSTAIRCVMRKMAAMKGRLV